MERTLARKSSMLAAGWSEALELSRVDYKGLDLADPKPFGDAPPRGSLVLSLSGDDVLDVVSDAMEAEVPADVDTSIPMFMCVDVDEVDSSRVLLKAKAPRGGSLPPVMEGDVRVDEKMARLVIESMPPSGTLARAWVRFRYYSPFTTEDGNTMQGVSCLLCGIELGDSGGEMPV